MACVCACGLQAWESNVPLNLDTWDRDKVLFMTALYVRESIASVLEEIAREEQNTKDTKSVPVLQPPICSGGGSERGGGWRDGAENFGTTDRTIRKREEITPSLPSLLLERFLDDKWRRGRT